MSNKWIKNENGVWVKQPRFPVGTVIELLSTVDPDEIYSDCRWVKIEDVTSGTQNTTKWAYEPLKVTFKYVDPATSTLTSAVSYINSDGTTTGISFPTLDTTDTRYTLLGWKDESNDSPVDSIPAYCNSDRTYYACFSQKKPEEGTDFKIVAPLKAGTDGNTFNVTKLSSNLVCNNNSTELGYFRFTNSIYSNTVNSTQYAQLYFPEETNGDKTQVYVEPSEVVAVPIKFAKAAPTLGTDFTVSGTTVTSSSDKVLEVLSSDGTTVVATLSASGSSYTGGSYIRFKETYMYNASANTAL